jgi:lipid II:glycine glycyltransferase (peptidoglycan interpeptide bridge formation enzyme)
MIFPENRRQEWNAFVAAAPAGDVLQCWEWGELKADTGWEALPVAVEADGRLTGAALVLKRRLPHTRRSLLYCPRGPVVDTGVPGALEALLAEVREVAREHGAIAFKMDPAWTPEQSLLQRLRALGMRPPRGGAGFGATQPRAVMKVDIRPSEDELLARFHSKWRYNLRLAAKKGVTVTADTSRADVDTFYDLLLVTAKRDGFRVRARTYFHRIWDILIARSMGRLFLARVGDTAVSGALVFVLGRQCWYVYGASDNDHRNLMPNHLLQWEIMRWAKRQGCEVYDMRGVSPEVNGEPVEKHLAGLNRFKRGFGAQYVEYIGDWDLVFSPLWYAAFERALPHVRALLGRKAAGAAGD